MCWTCVMARRKKPEIESYDDPLGLDNPLPDAAYPPEPVVVTGLSDEEDAARHLALRFNRDLRFCPNCEAIVDVTKMKDPHHHWCSYCGDTLRPLGTKPRIRKFDAR